MKPLPWSHSRLEDFKNCPRAFAEKQVFKSVVEEKGEATIWGERVHKHFEEYLTDRTVLPAELLCHVPYLNKLMAMEGKLTVEEKIALNLAGTPCEFFGDSVWFRGVIDVKIVNKNRAWIVDHKTGKQHTKFGQLRLFALHTFVAHPEVDQVWAEYYWTQTMSRTNEMYFRDEIEKMWAAFIPDLKQYAQAFREEVWQPRQSGLCNGWCPVTGCEFWRPKRRKN
jgi:ATP-dependent exoDNAse (exonuclease V) beta subunit